ncbi:hypothetical protein [Gottfriedia acidiceleris]|uniref:hypothetical protein n=1 Tax=Gottfriedia acidiceleris TaxID=371036 RepID=UPI001F2F5464|nr:hypothetical protein [Gottfriedia acidiceleris]
MLKRSITTLCLYSIFLCVFHSTNTNAKINLPKSINQQNNNECLELKERLNSLEPPKPITILKSPEQKETEGNYPTNTFSISEILSKGTKIPFNIIKNEPNYERPIYQEQWHSTYRRWSYIPSRIYYAQHRLFPIYDIGLTNLFNIGNHLGIGFPTFQNQADLDLYLIVFQTNVTKVYTKENQIVVVGNPQRNGVQVITVKTKDIHPSDFKKMLLIQLAINSYELDYSLINYQPPDYWKKHIKQNQKIPWGIKNTCN